MGGTVTIKVAGRAHEIVVQAGETILDSLLRAGEFVDNPCNGLGKCGKCKVRIQGGACNALSAEELKLLKREELASGVRLSCCAKPYTDVCLEVLSSLGEHDVLTAGYVPSFQRDPLEGYGFAIDIGTTTVVVTLVDLATGAELASASDINAQKTFGLDVLSRIAYEQEYPQTGISELQNAIVNSLNQLMQQACDSAGVELAAVSKLSVAANCTMMHMLLGVDARSIGAAPYAPQFTEAKTLPAASIGLRCGPRALLYCLPHVSSFIGADIVAGAYVCEMDKAQANELFIDIGTNGEIVLSKKGALYSCSCAAGPALEGMNISCGMRAAKGAIEDLFMRQEGIELKTIGGAAPVGLCGSGILAAIRELVKTGIVQKNGVIVRPAQLDADDWRAAYVRVNEEGKREILLHESPEIMVTQGDVRQVQMAKGAILSGFLALLDAANLKMEELDKVYIAGQFGAHLSVDSLIGSGILPPSVKDKIVYVGNSSKMGAYIALLSKRGASEIEQLAGKINYIELSDTQNYARLFSDCMKFPQEGSGAGA